MTLPHKRVLSELKSRGYKFEPHCWDMVIANGDTPNCPRQWRAFAKNNKGKNVLLNVYESFTIGNKVFTWGVEEFDPVVRFDINRKESSSKL